VDLSVKLAGMDLPNPVLAASGTFGCGDEYAGLTEAQGLGGIISKAVTLRPCSGNPPPRLWETPSGLLNSIGLQNKGVEAFVSEDLPRLLSHGVPVIANLAGFSQEEYLETAIRLQEAGGLSGVELNISCPNVKSGGYHFGADPRTAAGLVGKVREALRLPLLVKLGPRVADLAGMAKAVADAGADGISVANTFPGMAVDIESWKPRLGAVTGGLSGPAVRPLAVRAVWEVSRAVDLPVLACGGITGWEDAVEMLLVGARAVAVGTALFSEPRTPALILEGLKGYLQRKGIRRWEDIVGRVAV
jgi:dihydroorotate dehydrogenase (NAD+) catalytic subunit